MSKVKQCGDRLKIWAGAWKEVPCMKPEHDSNESHAGRMQDGLGNDVDLTWDYDFSRYEMTECESNAEGEGFGMSEERANGEYPQPFGSVGIFRICEHCNKEYRVPLHITHNVGRHEAVHNFGPCPECGHRDDVWLRVTITPNAPGQPRLAERKTTDE